MRVANVARWLAITLLTLLFALAGARADELSDIKKRIDEIVIPSIGISDETVELARRFVSLNRERFGAQSNEYADALNVLGKYLHLQGRLDEAEAIFREEFGIRRQAYAERPLDAIAEEADRLAARNAIDRAFPLALGYADEVKARSGERSPEFAAALHRLAQLHIWSTSYARADELCRSALEIREAILPADHVDIASNLGLLIEVLRIRKGNSAVEIEAPQNRLVQLWYARAIGPQATAQDRMMLETWSAYHSTYLGAAGRWSEAAKTDLRSLDVQRTYKKESQLLHAILWTAQGLIQAGMTGEGEKLYREAISLGQASPQNVRDELVAAELVTAIVFVAEQAAGRGDLDAAMKLFEHQITVFERVIGSDFDVATELLRAQARGG